MMGRGMIPSSPVPVPVRLVFLCGSGLPGPGGVLRRRLGLLDEQLLLGSLDGLQGGRGRLDIDLVARQLGCQAGPTQAPMGSTLGSADQTASLVREPASRAMDLTSTVPS